MKKVLLILSFIFCIFFINVDVNASYECNANKALFEDDAVKEIKYNGVYYTVNVLTDIKFNIIYNQESNKVNYTGKFKINGSTFTKNYDTSNTTGTFNVSQTIHDSFVGHFGTAPINATSNKDKISFYLDPETCNLVSGNEGVNPSYNIQFDCVYTDDGVGEKIDIIEDKPAENVVDENGNVDPTKKQCVYHIFGKNGYNASEANNQVVILIEDNGNNNINVSLSENGNRVLNNIRFIVSSIKDTYIKSGNCIGYFYVDSSVGEAWMSDNGQSYYDYYELGEYKYSNYANYPSDEPETSPLWGGNLSRDGDCGVLNDINDILQEYILKPIRYLVPIIFLIMTSIDFAKSIFANDKNGIGKAKNNLLKRIIISIIVFFVSNIVEMLFNLFNLNC